MSFIAYLLAFRGAASADGNRHFGRRSKIEARWAGDANAVRSHDVGGRRLGDTGYRGMVWGWSGGLPKKF